MSLRVGTGVDAHGFAPDPFTHVGWSRAIAPAGAAR